MTFEEWLPTFSSDNYITTADIKEIWNAAIASVDASLDSLADAGGDIAWHSLVLKLKELKSS